MGRPIRGVLVVDQAASNLEELRGVANVVAKWYMFEFGLKAELGLVLMNSGKSKNLLRKIHKNDYAGVFEACMLSKPSLELFEWLRQECEAAEPGEAWPEKGASLSTDALLVAREMLEDRRGVGEKAKGLREVVYYLTDTHGGPRASEVNVFKRAAKQRFAKEGVELAAFVVCGENNKDASSPEDAEAARLLEMAAKEKIPGGIYHCGDGEELEAAATKHCAEERRQTAGAAKATAVDFVVGPGLAVKCEATKRVALGAFPTTRKEAIPAATTLARWQAKHDAGEIDELPEKTDDAVLTDRQYYAVGGVDEDDEDDGFLTGATSAAVKDADVVDAYDYGGLIMPASSVEAALAGVIGAQREPEASAETTAYGAGSNPKSKLRLVVLAAVQRDHVLADRSTLCAPADDLYLASADARAAALLAALASSLDRKNAAFVVRATNATTVDRLCALIPPGPWSSSSSSSSSSDQPWLVRTLPWADQTVRSEGPLQALFARGTIQGMTRRKRYLEEEEGTTPDGAPSSSSPAESLPDVVGEQSLVDDRMASEKDRDDDDDDDRAPKRLRRAADRLVATQRLDLEKAKAAVAQQPDVHLERILEYLRRRATPKNAPRTDLDADSLVPPIGKAHMGVWRDAILDLDAGDTEAANVEFAKAADAVLEKARASKARAEAEADFDFSDATRTLAPVAFGADENEPRPAPVQPRAPNPISSVRPVAVFRDLVDAANRRGDDADADRALDCMRRRILDVLVVAKDDDPEYFNLAAECLVALRTASEPTPANRRAYNAFVREAVLPARDNYLDFKGALDDNGLREHADLLLHHDEYHDLPATCPDPMRTLPPHPAALYGGGGDDDDDDLEAWE